MQKLCSSGISGKRGALWKVREDGWTIVQGEDRTKKAKEYRTTV